MYKIIGADGHEYGPVSEDQFRQWIAEGRANAQTHAQAEGDSVWRTVADFPEFRASLGLPGGVPPSLSSPAQPRRSTRPPGADKKIAAGVLALIPLTGSLGIHKFILGYTGEGLTMLLITLLTCGVGASVMWIIALVEGITYLTKSDEEFVRTYVQNKKGWF